MEGSNKPNSEEFSSSQAYTGLGAEEEDDGDDAYEALANKTAAYISQIRAQDGSYGTPQFDVSLPVIRNQ